MSKKWYDHLGNEFSSKQEMYDYYNIPIGLFRSRERRGWSLQKILTTPRIDKYESKSWQDHLGNNFSSKRKMCDFYKINVTTFNDRIEMGWSLERALTTPPLQTKFAKHPITDHLGNNFSSKHKMCRHYKINVATFNSRIEMGWSLERALTTPLQIKHTITDHLGNEYRNRLEMCDFYKIALSTFNDRISKGWSLERTLTTPVREHGSKDHLGNNFSSKQKMLDFYGISRWTFDTRIAMGWSLERALTEPIQKKNK